MWRILFHRFIGAGRNCDARNKRETERKQISINFCRAHLNVVCVCGSAFGIWQYFSMSTAATAHRLQCVKPVHFNHINSMTNLFFVVATNDSRMMNSRDENSDSDCFFFCFLKFMVKNGKSKIGSESEC